MTTATRSLAYSPGDAYLDASAERRSAAIRDRNATRKAMALEEERRQRPPDLRYCGTRLQTTRPWHADTRHPVRQFMAVRR